jgi:hypothetical protein
MPSVAKSCKYMQGLGISHIYIRDQRAKLNIQKVGQISRSRLQVKKTLVCNNTGFFFRKNSHMKTTKEIFMRKNKVSMDKQSACSFNLW